MTLRNPHALSGAERTVALTRIRVAHLTEALAAEPIDRGTYAELAAFLEGPAWRACDALDALCGPSAAGECERIAEVLAGTPDAVTRNGTSPAGSCRTTS